MAIFEAFYERFIVEYENNEVAFFLLLIKTRWWEKQVRWKLKRFKVNLPP